MNDFHPPSKVEVKDPPTIEDIKLLDETPLAAQEEKKLGFLKEQLFLLSKPIQGRRYSPSLLGLSIMWNQSSACLYKQILADGVLTLPSMKHIRRLTSALSVDYNLLDSTMTYLEARVPN